MMRHAVLLLSVGCVAARTASLAQDIAMEELPGEEVDHSHKAMSGAARPWWDYDYDIVGGDTQVPVDTEDEAARAAKVQGGTPLTSATQLFPVGEVVNYFVAEPLASNRVANDIAAAVADWEAKTCFRFAQCFSDEECPRPVMVFVSGDGCSSPVGRRSAGVNTITLANGCGVGAAIHEIGHSLGLSHEQSRKDRDDFVFVDLAQVQSGLENNFQKNGASARDMGAYDYSSIMHYGPNGFAIGRQPTIVSPEAIGQRVALSPTDVQAIEFMYNECSATFSAPRCLASVDASVTEVIPVGQVYDVDINVVYDAAQTMTVSYTGTTAPGTTVSRGPGTSLRDTGFTTMAFTPSAADAGVTYVLSATFTGANNAASTCSVSVRVEGTPVTVPAPQPVSTSVPAVPVAPTSVPETAAPASEPAAGCTTVRASFDVQAQIGSASYTVLSTRVKQSGAASLALTQTARAAEYSVGAVQPDSVTYYARVENTNAQLTVRLIGSSGAAINVVFGVNSRLYVNTRLTASSASFTGYTRTAAVVQASTFQQVTVQFNWEAGRFAVRVGGSSTGAREIPDGLDAITGVQIFAGVAVPVFVDELVLSCQ